MQADPEMHHTRLCIAKRKHICGTVCFVDCVSCCILIFSLVALMGFMRASTIQQRGTMLKLKYSLSHAANEIANYILYLIYSIILCLMYKSLQRIHGKRLYIFSPVGLPLVLYILYICTSQNIALKFTGNHAL